MEYYHYGLLLIVSVSSLLANKNDLAEQRIRQIMDLLPQNEVESLHFGVYFKGIEDLDLAASEWDLIVKVPQLPPPPRIKERRLCEAIPTVQEVANYYEKKFGLPKEHKATFKASSYNLTRFTFCSSHNKLIDGQALVLNYTNTKSEDLYENLNLLTGNRIDLPQPGLPTNFWPHNYQEAGYIDLTIPEPITVAPTYPSTTTPDLSAQWSEHYRQLIQEANASVRWRQHFKEQRRSIPRNGSNIPKTRVKRVRAKRGVLNFVGKAAKALFGTATSRDVSRLQDKVERIRNRQAKLEGEMTTIVSLHGDRLDFVTEIMNSTLDKVAVLQENHRAMQADDLIDETVERIYLHVILETMADLILTGQVLEGYQDEMRDRGVGMIRLNNELLSPVIVPLHDLRSGLDMVEEQVAVSAAPFQFAFTDLGYFYSVPGISYLSDRNFLYVRIPVPLTVLNSNYRVYQPNAVPLRASTDPRYYTQITNLPEYVGFSSQGDTYTSFGQKFLNTCKGFGVKKCPSRIAEISTTVPSCVLGLFLNNANMTTEYCTSELVISATLSEQILDVGQGKYFLSANSTGDTWVIQCPRLRPRITEPCTSCVITLGCMCSLKTKSAFISASLVNCETTTEFTTIHRSYIPNLIWISKLREYTDFTGAMYNTTAVMTTDPILDLPPLPLPIYDEIKEFSDKNAMIKTNLDRIMKLAQENKPLYVTKVQEISTQAKHSMKAFYIASLALVWTAILTVAFAFAGKYMCYILVTLKQVHQAATSPITSNPTTLPLPPLFRIIMWYMAMLMTVYIILHSAYLVWKWYDGAQKRKNYHPLKGDDPPSTTVYLKIWTPFRLATLFMDRICVPLGEVKVNDNHHNTLHLRIRYKVWCNELVFQWAGISLQHEEGLRILLPHSIRIPKPINRLVTTIAGDDNISASILLKSGPTQKEHKLKVKTLQENPDIMNFRVHNANLARQVRQYKQAIRPSTLHVRQAPPKPPRSPRAPKSPKMARHPYAHKTPPPRRTHIKTNPFSSSESIPHKFARIQSDPNINSLKRAMQTPYEPNDNFSFSDSEFTKQNKTQAVNLFKGSMITLPPTPKLRTKNESQTDTHYASIELPNIHLSDID